MCASRSSAAPWTPERRELEEVVARAAPPQRQVLEIDAPVAHAHDRARLLLLEVVFGAELHAARPDVEGDLLLVVGREAAELDVVDGDLAAGRERLEAQRSVLGHGPAGDRAQAGLDGGGHAGRVRQAVHGDVDVAHVGDERRLDRFVAKVHRGLFQREAIEREPRPRPGVLGLLRAVLRFVLAAAFASARLRVVLRRLAGSRRQVSARFSVPSRSLRTCRSRPAIETSATWNRCAVRSLSPIFTANRSSVHSGRSAGLVLLLDVQLLERDVALHGQLGRAVARAHEADVQRQRQARRLDRERQAHRHERQIARQVQRLQPQLEHGLERILERLGAPLDRERRAVDRHAQPRLDERIQVHRQRRHERHADRSGR